MPMDFQEQYIQNQEMAKIRLDQWKITKNMPM